jgi:seryl-tRNA synthetase
MKLFGQSTDNPARALENEIAAATAHIEKLTAQFAATEKMRQAATGRVEKLTTELAAVEKRRQDIQNEKTATTARVEELTAELVAVEKKRQDLQNEKTTATARIEELTTELVGVEEKRQDNQKAIVELQRRRREAEQRFAVLQEGKVAAPSTPEITSSTVEKRKPSASNGLTLLLGFAVGAAAVLWLPWQLTAIATSLLCLLVLIVFYRAQTKLPPDGGAKIGISGSDGAI